MGLEQQIPQDIHELAQRLNLKITYCSYWSATLGEDLRRWRLCLAKGKDGVLESWAIALSQDDHGDELIKAEMRDHEGCTVAIGRAKDANGALSHLQVDYHQAWELYKADVRVHIRVIRELVERCET